MDKVILTLDQNKIDPSVSKDNRENYYVRHAARAVLYDDEKVALMYSGQKRYYKLPGGGIDEGEEIDEALARELMEETGCVAKVIENLGTTEEWRDFASMHQISYAYSAIKISQDYSPSFTQSEIDEEFELVWATDINKAIRMVESNIQNKDVRVSFMAQRDTAILRAAKSVSRDF